MEIIKKYTKAFVRDAHGNVVVAQPPNVVLILWAVAAIATRLIDVHPWHDGFSWLGSALLFTWAYLELTQGVSYFRRTLGGLVVLFLVITHFMSA